MIVLLSPELRIVAEGGICYELQRKAAKGAKSKKTDEFAWKSLGYYASLEQACLAAISKRLCQDIGEVNAKELIAEIRASAKAFSSACATSMASQTTGDKHDLS